MEGGNKKFQNAYSTNKPIHSLQCLIFTTWGQCSPMSVQGNLYTVLVTAKQGPPYYTIDPHICFLLNNTNSGVVALVSVCDKKKWYWSVVTSVFVQHTHTHS